MIPPTIPIDEARRLFALRRLQILDTDAEPAFDNITRLAQKIFDVPIALISLVDRDRQWFKSRVGIAATEMPREISFCGHAIHDDRLFIVNDAREDRRFSDNPTVTGAPAVRAYGGAPLHAPGGERIGTLCVVDTRPRTFSPEELEPLHVLAEIVEDMLCRSDDALRTAYYDALTTLPNRLLMLDKLNLAIAQADTAQQSVAVLVVNIDQFKTINQSLGHQFGDSVLKLAARRIVDCAGGRTTVGRSGADEFIVMQMPQDEAALAQLADRLLITLAEPFQIGEREIHITASIGISRFPEDGRAADTLLSCADIALTQAKEAGRNIAHVYTADARLEPHHRFQLGNDLRLALQRGEFELFFQPELCLTRGTVIGTEALLRWNHPRLGLLGPADFIEVAEDSGLIVPIGEWVLQEACREAQRWRALGVDDCAVAVNLSALQFKRNNLEQSVADALQCAGLAPELLELELTESILIGDNESTLARINRLKALGIRLAIDDFGTGYSNLAYLRRFAFDKLKIDQSFIRRLLKSDEDRAIVKAIIQLANSLRLTTVAEGVETDAQLQQLRELDCDNVQGYLFAKPMAASAIRDFLSARLRLPDASTSS